LERENMLKRTIFLITLIYFTFAIQSYASDYIKVADLSKENISLYAKENKGKGLYLHFKLISNNQAYYFPNWVSTTNPDYHPIMRSRDIDNDGKDELDIILPNGKKPIRHILKIINGHLEEI
jgi:hypothetical protein